MENGRRVPRLRVCLKAEITYGGGAFRRDCQVRDMSETGARLIIKDTMTLPADFSLTIPNRPDVTRAIVKWRHEGQVGVAFAGAGMVAAPRFAPQPRPEDELEAARAENARLNRMIVDLQDTIAAMKKSLAQFAIEDAKSVAKSERKLAKKAG